MLSKNFAQKHYISARINQYFVSNFMIFYDKDLLNIFNPFATVWSNVPVRAAMRLSKPRAMKSTA